MFSATFPGPYDVTLLGGSSLSVEVSDEDVTVNDPMFACEAVPITADLLRARSLACNSSDGFTVAFQIDPR